VALCPSSVIELADLPDAVRAGALDRSAAVLRGPALSPNSCSRLATARERGERDDIVAALQKAGNNRLRAAVALGISRRTLYKKLHRYGLMDRATDRLSGGYLLAGSSG
jgi:transcriptional regulator of acetoin/glycerol metabolism